MAECPRIYNSRAFLAKSFYLAFNDLTKISQRKTYNDWHRNDI